MWPHLESEYVSTSVVIGKYNDFHLAIASRIHIQKHLWFYLHIIYEITVILVKWMPI